MIFRLIVSFLRVYIKPIVKISNEKFLGYPCDVLFFVFKIVIIPFQDVCRH